MKKIFLLFVISFIVLDIFAEAAFYQNVGSNQYNKIVFDFGSVNEWKRADTEIDGVSYGSKYVTDTWKLKGAEGYVWKNNGSDISSMTLYYRVYKQGSTAPSFSTINIPWHSNVGGDNQRWAKDDYDIDLLSLVTSGGTWVMEFYYSAATNGTNCLNPIFWSNSGSNYKLTFTSYIIQSSSAGNWNTGSNWHGSSVPTSSYSVRISNNIDVDIAAETHSMLIGFGSVLSIEAEKSLTVNNTLTNNAGNSGLVLKSDATGNGSLIFSGTGPEATIERYIELYSGSNNGWHLISSSMSGNVTVAGTGFVPTSGDDDLFRFDEEFNEWKNYLVSTFAFAEGQGYLIARKTTTTGNITGTLLASDKTFTNLSFSSSQGNGWHLLGNPFSSAIKWNYGNWNLSNIAGTAKVLNASGNYVDMTEGIIPLTNGFFVQVSDGTNSITIPTNAQIHNTTNNYKTVTSNLLVINVTNDANTFSDKNKVGIRQDASMDYDLEFDSHKLF
ncbi:MAG: hypothetical protein U9R19_06070, partial [Bacteroidota bacterium]|nr:hypothetical protein [Bacteroidota bacterium]